MSAILNIGLHVNGKPELTPAQVLCAVWKTGSLILAHTVKESTTEPTVVLEIARPLNRTEGELVANELRQEAIAQLHKGTGELFGPKAQEWGPFNPEFFLTFEE